MKKLEIRKVYDASEDHQLYFPLDDDFYVLNIRYSAFVPGAATAFKLKQCVGTVTSADDFIEIDETNAVIDDASGSLIYRNATPERSHFLMIDYTADGNDAAAEFYVEIGRSRNG